MSQAATVSSISTAKQRNLIDRAVELQAQITELKTKLEDITSQFKAMGPGDYEGRDGHAIQVRRSTRLSLDAKIVKGFLTPAQVIEATKSAVVTTATVR